VADEKKETVTGRLNVPGPEEQKLPSEIDIDDVIGPVKPRKVMVVGPPNHHSLASEAILAPGRPAPPENIIGSMNDNATVREIVLHDSPVNQDGQDLDGGVQVQQPRPTPMTRVLQHYFARKKFDRAKPKPKGFKTKSKLKKQMEKKSRRRNR
jgi:hypothetical protein